MMKKIKFKLLIFEKLSMDVNKKVFFYSEFTYNYSLNWRMFCQIT